MDWFKVPERTAIALAWSSVVVAGCATRVNKASAPASTQPSHQSAALPASEVVVAEVEPGTASSQPRPDRPEDAGEQRLPTLSSFEPPIGAPCEPATPGESPALLDEHGNPVDLTNASDLEAVAGHKVLFCTPIRHAISGRVLSSNGSGPVTDATVRVESWWAVAPIAGRQPERHFLVSAQARTDASGDWSIPPEFRWMPGVLAADGFPFVVHSECVRAPGYVPFTFDPWASTGGTFDKPPTEVALQRGTATELEEQPDRSACGIALGPPLLP